MEENAQKPIYLIAGIAAALMVIALVIGMVMLATRKSSEISDKIVGFTDAAIESTYTQYDGNTVTGSQVINIIKNLEASDDVLYICVKTNANTSGTYYVYDNNLTEIAADAEKTNMKNAQTKSSTSYITPKGKFLCTIDRNANKAMIGMTIEQQ